MDYLARLRTWYEHERDCNAQMLAMLESVPLDRRVDPSFQRAVDLASHLAACRENWLDRMASGGQEQGQWWQNGTKIESLQPRFSSLEQQWTDYLANLDEEALEADFELAGSDGTRYRWNVEGQIVQLVGHAFYHRGQIAMLVDELGGETVDTDFLFWAYQREGRYGKV